MDKMSRNLSHKSLLAQFPPITCRSSRGSIFRQDVQPNVSISSNRRSINYEAQNISAAERSKYCLYGSKKKQVQVSKETGGPAVKQLTLFEQLVDRS